MTLKEWLEQERRTLVWLSKELGYTSSVAPHTWLKGTAKPSLENVVAIEKLTKGKVKYKDWVGE